MEEAFAYTLFAVAVLLLICIVADIACKPAAAPNDRKDEPVELRFLGVTAGKGVILHYKGNDVRILFADAAGVEQTESSLIFRSVPGGLILERRTTAPKDS